MYFIFFIKNYKMWRFNILKKYLNSDILESRDSEYWECEHSS